MAIVDQARTSSRHLALAAAAVLVCACAANPKTAKTSSEVIDGANAAAPAPAEAPAEASAAVPPGSCTADADCQDGERCQAGRCVAAPAMCSLVRVRFAFDSAQLDDKAMELLRENASCVSKRKATSLLVEGHCDERGTTEYNIALGARRADAVKRYLSALGVTATIDSVSFGKEIPIANGSGDSVWAQNRRAELRLPGEKRSDGRLVAGR